jgi:4-hydroxy-tetrahydrodipicolinate synthase
MGTKFNGTGVALVTPFNQSLQLDLAAMKRLLDHTGGVDYWVVNGTTGESPVLTEVERNKILHFVGENNPGDLPIMYGIGGNNTQAVLQQIKITDFSHITSILSVCPYYNKPTQEGLFQHYSAIAEHSPVPVYIYNVPGRTSCNIEAETLLRLAAHDNIHGVKEASPDPNQWKTVGSYKPENFQLISGDDMSTVSIIRNGGSGVISVLANAFPDLMCKMVNHSLDHQWQEAERILEVLLPVNPLMYQESNPVGIKKALHLMGICEPYVRLPLVQASEQLSDKIAALLPATVA